MSLQESTKALTKTPTTRKLTVSLPSADRREVIANYSAQPL